MDVLRAAPKKYKGFKVGKRKLRVHAIDAGNAEPARPCGKWRVKR